MDDAGPELCSCMPEDPKQTLALVREMTVETHLLEQGRHRVDILRCRCGQRYLYASYELIDGEGGHDAQATVACALSPSEGVSWTAGDPSVEGALRTLPARRQAVDLRPRHQALSSVLWIDGPIHWSPRD